MFFELPKNLETFENELAHLENLESSRMRSARKWEKRARNSGPAFPPGHLSPTWTCLRLKEFITTNCKCEGGRRGRFEAGASANGNERGTNTVGRIRIVGGGSIRDDDKRYSSMFDDAQIQIQFLFTFRRL